MSDSPDPHPGLTVTGGAGGVIARIEELIALGAALDRAAAALKRADHALVQACTVLDAEVGWSGPAALERLAGPHGLRTTAFASATLADRVRTTASRYADAEVDASARLRAVVTVAGHAAGEAGPLAWAVGAVLALDAVAVLAWTRALRWTPTPVGAGLRWLGSDGAQLPGFWGATGRLLTGPGLLPELPSPDRWAAGAAASGVGAFVWGAQPGRQPLPPDPTRLGAGVVVGGLRLAGADTRLQVTPVGVRRDRPPSTEADLLDLVADQYDQSSDEAGQVAVQRLEHADGSVSWVVAIPGTQSAGVGGSNPFDAASDLELAAGVPSDVTALVLRAMEQAGVGADEPVVIAGHSLGGMVAMEVAEQGGYHVAAVLTAGSPVAGATLPQGAAALHLEHAQDPVPGLAGGANPPTVNRTTVVRDLAVPQAEPSAFDGAGGDGPSVSQAHSLDAYRRTAELLPADDPSVQGFRDALDEVLGGYVVSATTWTFTGERVPVDAP